MTLTAPTPVLEFNEPAGLTARGTLIVLAGRGESVGVYERFGRRLSADSWRVRVVPTTPDVAAAEAAVDALLADDALPAPRLLVGSDAGAALAVSIASRTTEPLAGLVLAGLPTSTEQSAEGEEPELRSACPVHRKTLDNESLVTPGALAQDLPESLRLPDASSLALPVLAIHGDSDPVVPQATAAKYYRAIPSHEIVSVRGGRHDVLNDLSHRSVAATIVLFIERLKAGAVIVEPLD